jgi:hypothetical protein
MTMLLSGAVDLRWGWESGGSPQNLQETRQPTTHASVKTLVNWTFLTEPTRPALRCKAQHRIRLTGRLVPSALKRLSTLR